MDIATLSLLMLGTLVGLMVIGVPFAFSLGGTALIFGLWQFGSASLFLIASRYYSFLNEFILLSVPMFVLMASLIEKTGMATRLFDAMQTIAGRLRGGVAVQTLVVAVIIAATTGIIGGEIVLLGLVALPQMLRLNYDRKLAIGVVCAGGSLGTMIPPSIVLIFYGLTANVSIGDMFTANLLPGLLLAGIYIAYVLIMCSIWPEMAPRPSPESLGPRMTGWQLTGAIGYPGLIVCSVLGTIYFGIASISEAATMGVIAVLAIGFLTRELTIDALYESLYRTLKTCGMLIWLTLGASALISVYNLMGGIHFVSELFKGLNLGPHGSMLLMFVIWFILGMFIDWLGILFLTIPVFAPIAVSFGYDLVWFGVLFCIAMQMSYLTPPFGWAALYLKSVAPPEIKLSEIYMGLLPFIGLQALALALVYSFPQIALWLPSLR
jgi:tripartite ATP-independent transporter DctM subunit